MVTLCMAGLSPEPGWGGDQFGDSKAKFNEGAFEVWASLCKQDMSALPVEFRVFDAAEIVAAVEAPIVSSLISLLSSKTNQVEAIRSPECNQ